MTIVIGDGRTRHRHYRSDHRSLRTGTIVRAVSPSIGLLGLLTFLIAAWGGIVPYVGPLFGFSADGRGSWDWSLTHSVLALVPGAIGCLAAIVLWSESARVTVGLGRIAMVIAGMASVICGAWFVVGPFAWPLVDNTPAYFVAAGPLRELSYLLGYALGPGFILGACGAYALGWATRHRPPTVAPEGVAVAGVSPSVVVPATMPPATMPSSTVPTNMPAGPLPATVPSSTVPAGPRVVAESGIDTSAVGGAGGAEANPPVPPLL